MLDDVPIAGQLPINMVRGLVWSSETPRPRLPASARLPERKSIFCAMPWLHAYQKHHDTEDFRTFVFDVQAGFQ
jgi:hypothetical protein